MAAYTVAGLVLAYPLNTIYGDSVARVGQAFYVLWSRDPHLGAIGFVWPPLQSLLEMPLVALWPVAHFMVDHAVAGILVSSASAALSVVVLSRTLRVFYLDALERWVLVALYAASPMTVLYAANGMTEALFVLLLLTACLYATEYLYGSQDPALVGLAVAVAVAFFVRYDSLAPAIALGTFLVVTSRLGERDPNRLEAHLLTYGSPIVYAVTIWIFANWVIMKDPFYFARSQYSNAAQQAAIAAGTDPALKGTFHSFAGSLLYALERASTVYPLFLPVLLVLLAIFLRERHRLALLLVLLLPSVVLFHALLLFLGQSHGELRYFITALPFGSLAAGYIVSRTRPRQYLALAMVALLSLGGWAVTIGALGNYAFSKEEVAHAFDHVPGVGQALNDQHLIAEQIAALHPGRGRVLLDTFGGNYLPLVSPDPQAYVVTSDRDFRFLLQEPQGHLDYILVPPPYGLGKLNEVNVIYPTLYQQGAIWAVRGPTFPDGLRLYQVLPLPH
jgi:hypothetical protein